MERRECDAAAAIDRRRSMNQFNRFRVAMATTRPFCRRPTMFGFTEFYRVSFRPQRTFSLGSSVPSLVTEFYRVFGVGCCCCCCRAVPCSGVVFLFWWRFIGRGRKGETAAIGHAIRSAPRTKQKTNAAATEKKRNTNHTEHVSQVDLLFKKKKKSNKQKRNAATPWPKCQSNPIQSKKNGKEPN